MPDFSLILGGAGTGKTTHLMSLMDKVIEAGVVDPFSIGFVTFTRAARAEASGRAAERLGLRQVDLEQRGWFRTVHSIAYRQLGVGKGLLTDDAEGRKWLQEALQAEVSVVPSGDQAAPFTQKTPAEAVLSIWHSARNRMVSLQAAVQDYNRASENPVGEQYSRQLIERYEQMKRLDGRCDFTDLLGRFAGWRFHVDGPLQTAPDGEVPQVEVWFCDEQQDSSRLQNAVLQRLTAGARWVYICGDPFQNIYRWAGADHRLLDGWPIPESRRRILPQTFRCPAPIHSLGERILSRCSDYWNRGIRPAEHSGEIGSDFLTGNWPDRLDPRESWLLLARTNQIAAQIIAILRDNSVPWVTTSGSGGWNAPKRNGATAALLALQDGYPINVEEWQMVVDYLPSKSDGSELLTRGTKKRFEKLDGESSSELNNLDGLETWGATETLRSRIASKSWTSLIDRGSQYVAARARWGFEAVHEPKIQVGTIHSAKGMEADNVALFTSISNPVLRSQETQDGYDEERRVEYVAVTRARRNLVLVEDDRAWKKKMELPV